MATVEDERKSQLSGTSPMAKWCLNSHLSGTFDDLIFYMCTDLCYIMSQFSRQGVEIEIVDSRGSAKASVIEHDAMAKVVSQYVPLRYV